MAVSNQKTTCYSSHTQFAKIRETGKHSDIDFAHNMRTKLPIDLHGQEVGLIMST
jgi:hypothetical protein